MSRIEDRLLDSIANSGSEHEKLVSSARLAIYYFHRGDSSKATELVDLIRASAHSSSSLDGIVYVNLAEATKLHQAASGDEAILKAKRALAFSVSSGRTDLVSLASVWLAHLEFNRGHYEQCLAFLKAALANKEHSPLIARTRLHMLIGDVVSFCGKDSDACKWYALARSTAVEEGDEVAIGQTIYNAAAVGFNNIRLSYVRGGAVEEQVRFIELMINSSSHFDLGVGSSAFESLLPILNAQLHLIRERYSDACRLFEHWLDGPNASVDPRLWTASRVDYAFALGGIGETENAMRQLAAIEADGVDGLPPDESAIVCFQLSRLYRSLGSVDCANDLRARAARDLSRHEEIQRELMSRLSQVLQAYSWL